MERTKGELGSADVAAFRRGICVAPTSSLPVTEPTAQQAGAVGQSLWSVRASPRALWKVARQEVGVSLQPPAKQGKGVQEEAFKPP